MAKKQHYMTYEERIQLETLLRHKIPVSEIARELGFSRQTIYREIKRGTYLHHGLLGRAALFCAKRPDHP